MAEWGLGPAFTPSGPVASVLGVLLAWESCGELSRALAGSCLVISYPWQVLLWQQSAELRFSAGKRADGVGDRKHQPGVS